MSKRVQCSEYRFSTGVNLTFAVVADLHDEVNPRILEEMTNRHPDAILIAGDLVDRPSAELRATTLEFLRSCVAIAPVFYAFGNHERFLLDPELREIESLGVTLLDNRWVEFRGCLIGGLSSDARDMITDHDRAEFRKNLVMRRKMSFFRRREHFKNDVYADRMHRYGTPDVSWLDDFENAGQCRLLLCHHPEYYERYLKQRKGIDAIVSGHAHGGQIRLFGRGLYSTGQGWFPRHTHGLYDGRLIVSRGLSNPADIVPRLFNPRELVFIRMS